MTTSYSQNMSCHSEKRQQRALVPVRCIAKMMVFLSIILGLSAVISTAVTLAEGLTAKSALFRQRVINGVQIDDDNHIVGKDITDDHHIGTGEQHLVEDDDIPTGGDSSVCDSNDIPSSPSSMQHSPCFVDAYLSTQSLRQQPPTLSVMSFNVYAGEDFKETRLPYIAEEIVGGPTKPYAMPDILLLQESTPKVIKAINEKLEKKYDNLHRYELVFTKTESLELGRNQPISPRGVE